MPTTTPSDAGVANWLPLVALAAMALLGLAMLLFGRVIHRAVLALIGVGVGLVVGGELARQFNFHPLLGGAALALTLGILGIVLARLFWAVVAAAFAVCLVAGATVGDQMRAEVEANPALKAAVEQGPLQASKEARQAVQAAVNHAVQKRSTVATVSAAVAALVGLVIGFFLPRAAVVVLTSLIGAAMLASAVGAGAVFLFHQPSERNSLAITIGFCAVLLLGLVVQSIAEIRSRRSEEESQEQEPAEPKRKTPAKAE